MYDSFPSSWISLVTSLGQFCCDALCHWPSSIASIPPWSWLPSGRIHIRPVLNEVYQVGRRPPRRSTASVVALSIPTEWPEGSLTTHPRNWNPCFTHLLVPHQPWINDLNTKSHFSVSYKQYCFCFNGPARCYLEYLLMCYSELCKYNIFAVVPHQNVPFQMENHKSTSSNDAMDSVISYYCIRCFS